MGRSGDVRVSLAMVLADSCVERAAPIALYHALGRLHEPELAHEFC